MTLHATVNITDVPLWFGNTWAAIRVASEDSADGLSVIEHRMPQGESPPLHIHHREDEVFHILSGVMRFRIDGVERVAGAGETVLAPRNIPHTFRVESADGARCLTFMRGADFQTMLRSVSRPALEDALPPLCTPTPAMIAQLEWRCAENGIDIIGPPL